MQEAFVSSFCSLDFDLKTLGVAQQQRGQRWEESRTKRKSVNSEKICNRKSFYIKTLGCKVN